MLDALIMAATRLARGCSHLRVEPIQIEPYEPGAVDAVVVRFAYGKNGFAKKTKMISDMVQMVSPHMGKKGCWGFFFVSPSHLDPPSDARTHPTSFHGDLPNLTSVASWQMRPRRAPSRRSTLGGSVTLLLVRVEGTMRDAFENMGCNLWSTMGCDMWGEMPCGTWKRMGGHMGRSVTSTSLHSRA